MDARPIWGHFEAFGHIWGHFEGIQAYLGGIIRDFGLNLGHFQAFVAKGGTFGTIWANVTLFKLIWGDFEGI